ncbi:FAD-dependent oxidoreductase [Patulibacter sp. SYSU D01012]|uniref:FAD-dependent oxidoreductase n=1 Tax=Patulibacter sp. SYSU D01012 TaxID=2817381 RepID=UPI001B3020C9|nr:FAD-dependent oxidoreductase [Patulibacter sp. SYSU D01012]
MSAVAVPRPTLGAALAPVDRALGRVTMYRLVLLLLAALALVALAYAAAGTLPYAPGDMVASAAVALGVAYGANRLVAPLFRVRPHAESALITGLLLFFLFWPSAKSGDLLDLGLAALLATLSKYLLAWRGRHLLNPAAAGAAIVGVTQLGATVWWVGGKELLPFVLVAAVVVLYRTRRLAVGATFVVVAGAIVTVRLVDGGQGVGDALTTALQSYPIVFLAGFMLSEPLTLPPRRVQALLVAALVGVLFAVPWHVGGVTSTPELALVLGNVLAFAFARRTGVRLRFVERRPLGPSTAEYVFAVDRPVRFAAGQYTELALPHGRADRRGVRRVFTIASAPGDGRTVAFGVRESPAGGRGSSFKRTLSGLEPGAVVAATTVAGDFVLPRDPAVPLLLVAGGIGITPFVSQLREAGAGEGVARDVVLVVGLTPGEGVPYRDVLARSGARVVLVGPDAPGDLPAGWTHVDAPLLAEDVLRRAVPDAADRAAYVSGPPAMVDAVRGALRRIGVRRVRTDHFAGY